MHEEENKLYYCGCYGTDMICEQGCGIELEDGKIMVYGSGDYYAAACLLEME